MNEKEKKSNEKALLKVKFLLPINCVLEIFQEMKPPEEQMDQDATAFSEACALRGKDEWMEDRRVWNAAGPAGKPTGSSDQ